MLIDSGGFQVFFLLGICKMREEGVEFCLYIDGLKYLFIFEWVMDIEWIIGVDIMMVFDECILGIVDYEYVKKLMQFIYCWLDCCIKYFNEIDFKYGY